MHFFAQNGYGGEGLGEDCGCELSGIFHGGYARDRLTKNFESPAFKCRLKEEQRLLRLHNHCIERYVLHE
jgi:hypothetical protein